MSHLEHVNMTVADVGKTAAWLCDVFDWKIRWQGDSLAGGYTAHVGNDQDYVAIYALKPANPKVDNNYTTVGGLNHIGVVVDDLDRVEDKVKSHGFETYSHADYEPGRRFYFRDSDGIEFEVVAYD